MTTADALLRACLENSHDDTARLAYADWLDERSDTDRAEFAGAGPCLICHGPEGPQPRGPNHPPARECLRCHGR